MYLKKIRALSCLRKKKLKKNKKQLFSLISVLWMSKQIRKTKKSDGVIFTWFFKFFRQMTFCTKTIGFLRKYRKPLIILIIPLIFSILPILSPTKVFSIIFVILFVKKHVLSLNYYCLLFQIFEADWPRVRYA